MDLTPREKDKLLLFTAALVAERRLARGVKLNHPEAIAYISAAILEGHLEHCVKMALSSDDGRDLVHVTSRISSPCGMRESSASRIRALVNCMQPSSIALVRNIFLSRP